MKIINNIDWHWKIENTYKDKICWFGVKKLPIIKIVFETKEGDSKEINNIVKGDFLTKQYLGLR